MVVEKKVFKLICSMLLVLPQVVLATLASIHEFPAHAGIYAGFSLTITLYLLVKYWVLEGKP